MSNRPPQIRQFLIVGRKFPTESDPNPTLFRMRIFHSNATLAKSRFWYYLKAQRKIKRAAGEIVSCSEIFEKRSYAVQNYGLVVKYTSTTGIINMYKEFRDVSLCGAVSQLFQDMASRHSASLDCIHIIKASVVGHKDLQRPKSITYDTAGIKFPKEFNYQRAPNLALKTRFQAHRPSTFRR